MLFIDRSVVLASLFIGGSLVFSYSPTEKHTLRECQDVDPSLAPRLSELDQHFCEALGAAHSLLKSSQYTLCNEETIVDAEGRRAVQLQLSHDGTLTVLFKGGVDFDHILNVSAWRKESRAAYNGGKRAEIDAHTAFEDAYWPTPLPYCEADGCTAARVSVVDWEALRDRVLKAIDALLLRVEQNGRKTPPSHIIVAGVSSGSPIAALCAAYLAAYTKHKPSALVLYGAPRLGNRAFAKHLEATFFHRFISLTGGADLLSLLPPLLGDWSHAGTHLLVQRSTADETGWTVDVCPEASKQDAFLPCKGDEKSSSWVSSNIALAYTHQLFLHAAGQTPTDKTHVQFLDPEGFLKLGPLKGVSIGTFLARFLHVNHSQFRGHNGFEYLQDVQFNKPLLTDEKKCHFGGVWKPHSVEEAPSKCGKSKVAIVDEVQCLIEGKHEAVQG